MPQGLERRCELLYAQKGSLDKFDRLNLLALMNALGYETAGLGLIQRSEFNRQYVSRKLAEVLTWNNEQMDYALRAIESHLQRSRTTRVSYTHIEVEETTTHGRGKERRTERMAHPMRKTKRRGTRTGKRGGRGR